MARYLTVSDVARRFGIRPRDISDLFYQRRLSDECCPVVGNRRLIPADYLPVIEAAVRGRAQETTATAVANLGTPVV
jgi:hypothetical protein